MIRKKVMYLVISLVILPSVFAQYFPYYFDFRNFYDYSPQLFDFLFFFMIFGGITRLVFTKLFTGKHGGLLGLGKEEPPGLKALYLGVSLALSVSGVYYGFLSLELLGPVTWPLLMLVLLLAVFAVLSYFMKNKKKAFLVAFLIWILLLLFIQGSAPSGVVRFLPENLSWAAILFFIIVAIIIGLLYRRIGDGENGAGARLRRGADSGLTNALNKLQSDMNKAISGMNDKFSQLNKKVENLEQLPNEMKRLFGDMLKDNQVIKGLDDKINNLGQGQEGIKRQLEEQKNNWKKEIDELAQKLRMLVEEGLKKYDQQIKNIAQGLESQIRELRREIENVKKIKVKDYGEEIKGLLKQLKDVEDTVLVRQMEAEKRLAELIDKRLATNADELNNNVDKLREAIRNTEEKQQNIDRRLGELSQSIERLSGMVEDIGKKKDVVVNNIRVTLIKAIDQGRRLISVIQGRVIQLSKEEQKKLTGREEFKLLGKGSLDINKILKQLKELIKLQNSQGSILVYNVMGKVNKLDRQDQELQKKLQLILEFLEEMESLEKNILGNVRALVNGFDRNNLNSDLRQFLNDLLRQDYRNDILNIKSLLMSLNWKNIIDGCVELKTFFEYRQNLFRNVERIVKSL